MAATFLPQWLVFSLVLGACFVQGGARADTVVPKTTVIRYATLAPAGSSFGKVLKAWSRSLDRETEGRVQLRYYSGGSQGDERDFIRKMRAGQIDAAGVTTVGLSIIVRQVLVLSAPGLIRSQEELERVYETMEGRFDSMFKEAGFVLLAWANAGRARIFSKKEPLAKPSDVKSRRPWAWKDDPIAAEFLRVIGANPVRLGIGEVYPGLQTNMIDVVFNSALGAVALQWYTQLDFMSKTAFGIVPGASVFRKDKFDELSAQDQRALLSTANRTKKALDAIVLRDDAGAYQTLLKRGIQESDTTPFEQEWEAAAAKTRQQLIGRIFSKSLLAAVTAAASGSPKTP